MADLRWLGAVQIAVPMLGTAMLPFIGINGVALMLSVGNVAGGIALVFSKPQVVV